jgi:hypothetical protein
LQGSDDLLEVRNSAVLIGERALELRCLLCQFIHPWISRLRIRDAARQKQDALAD